MTVRVERCARQERAAFAHHAAHAGQAFDEARLVEADHALGWIAAEPETHVRKLRSMPEGVDRMINALIDLVEELECGRWDWSHGAKVANLMGYRLMDVPIPRARALSEADRRGLPVPPARRWRGSAPDGAGGVGPEGPGGADRHRDRGAAGPPRDARLRPDRAGPGAGPDRAGFDPSKEATLARRYEAAAERAIYKALRELERVEAGAPEAAEEPTAPGSSRAEVPPAGPTPREPMPVAPSPRISAIPAVVRGNEGPMSVGPLDRGPA